MYPFLIVKLSVVMSNVVMPSFVAPSHSAFNITTLNKIDFIVILSVEDTQHNYTRH